VTKSAMRSSPVGTRPAVCVMTRRVGVASAQRHWRSVAGLSLAAMHVHCRIRRMIRPIGRVNTIVIGT
jgi:hypothetical protein